MIYFRIGEMIPKCDLPWGQERERLPQKFPGIWRMDKGIQEAPPLGVCGLSWSNLNYGLKTLKDKLPISPNM